ncbi:ORF12 [Cydia pomonella granulovirus]|uniref:ORF12 n=2 Tax=Cydia pomonella granulosis virus TaxID=28289 RepID=Q91F34_GVCPM|nr:ORF12 [Cydia pomonella granulovirus]AAK70679.1 ORF12 [Cydia pomonella granulovirus]AIU36661.1 ORF12 [Cydia pomonella granulovirus]AIU36938.1 ORF12 [Cydia pomonella granulovirus]AIU37080.1 ORF12 [Cydia pomonella granulovirus]AIU37222.1 ORF12 [Cydia pomonella granulovirus]
MEKTTNADTVNTAIANHTMLQIDRLFIEILKRLDTKNDTHQVYVLFGVWVVVIVLKCFAKRIIKRLIKKFQPNQAPI